MSSLEHDSLLRAALAPARALEPSAADVAAVLTRVGYRASARSSRAPRRAGRIRRAAPLALCAVALLGAGYAAAPPLRSAIDSVTGTFSSWVGGHINAAPGRPLAPGDKAPAYLRDPRYEHQPRVIAQAGGYALFVSRERGGMINFDLGNTGVGLAMSLNDRFFEQHALYVLGPGAMQHVDRHGHVPLFGITARSVRSVELTYDDGPPLRVGDVNGGFVLLARPAGSPHEVLAFDARGRILGRALVDNSPHFGAQIDWRRYERAPVTRPATPSTTPPAAH